LLIDKIIDIKEGEYITAIKNVTFNNSNGATNNKLSRYSPKGFTLPPKKPNKNIGAAICMIDKAETTK
jgi:hypothetical protein